VPGPRRLVGPTRWRIGRLVDTLYEGVLTVEHEDPVWGGTEDLVEAGLEVVHRTLRPLVVR